MKSSDQIASEWGMSKRTIKDLCNKGKIPGAIKNGRQWQISGNAKKYPGIIMELKWKSGLKEDAFEEHSMDALTQIDEKRYDLEMRALGIENIIKLGIAFSGKKVLISAR